MNSAAEREYLELQGRAVEILEEIAAIKYQLSIAKARHARSHDYSDSAWFHSANNALKKKQVEHQRLLIEAGVLRKKASEERRIRDAEANEERRISFERAFLLEAKKFLSENDFEEVIRRAEQSLEEA